MLVDLGQEVLENIVKDGVKEMFGQLAGGSRGRKQKTWFIAVKAAINEYQQKLKEDFLPVLLNDFSRKLVVKFSGGKMSEEDKNKIKLFMEMVKKSDVKSVEKELLEKLGDLEAAEENNEMKEKFENVKRIVSDGHNWILERLELHVRSVVSDAMYRNTVERSKIEVMLYNFVDGDVPDSVKKLFDNGMGAVPNTRLSKKEIDNRVEEALLEFLVRLGKRRICGTAVRQASGVQDWIRQVKLLNVDQDSKEFIETLENTLPALRAELDLVYREVDLESKEEMVKKLERESCVLKGMGMSLFTLETMRRADEDLMNQLGAVRIENTKDEIIQNVLNEIESFENGLTKEQKEYLDLTYGGRDHDLKNSVFPFLKSQHKIHKMSEEEIRNESS